MTNAELKRLYHLNREIDRLQDAVAVLEDPSLVTRLTGQPHGGGMSDRTGRSAVRLAAVRLRLEAARLEAMDEIERLTAFIEGIDDPLMRQIMQYRHMNGLNWDQVAAQIGGGMTGESCRKAHYRYLHGE